MSNRGAPDCPVVHRLFELEPALGQSGESHARLALRIIIVIGEGDRERFRPVGRRQPLDPLGPLAHAGDRRPEIADEKVGQTRIDGEDLHHRLDRLACVDKLDRRKPQPLGVDVARVDGHRAGDGAANVVPMPDIGGPGDERASAKNRHGEHHVVQMRDAAVIRIIGDENVSGRDVGSGDDFQEAFDRLVERADEAGNSGAGTDQIAARVGDAGSDVENLVDDRAHRRLSEDREHFVRRGGERLLNDGGRELVGRSQRWRLASHRARCFCRHSRKSNLKVNCASDRSRYIAEAA